MKKAVVVRAASILLACLLFATLASAQIIYLAKGTLTSSRAGSYKDLSGLNYKLENGVAANLIGGLGSGLTYAGGNTFLALPDRGPNAVPWNPLIDDTASYIPRFHTLTLDLRRNRGTGLPFTLTTKLESTTLLRSLFPLVYGSGDDLNVGTGRPKINDFFRHYFSGRSDNFDPNQNSGDPRDARLDPESIRLSRDGLTVFISDEYGPYVYQFLRATGERLRAFRLPDEFYVTKLFPVGNDEISQNTAGRVANKGIKGLAITPDGRTLVGIMQNALLQDANQGGSAKNLLRIVTIDVWSGRVTHQYAYLLDSSGVSDIVALNEHEFLVDERDGKGLGDTPGSKAKFKQIFKIDLKGAVDVSNMDGLTAAANAVKKTLFLDVVGALTDPDLGTDKLDVTQIPAKLEGITFGPDVNYNGKRLHTFWIANDNDFIQDFNNVVNSDPNTFFVFGFTDADLAGSEFVPQKIETPHFWW